MSGQPTIGLGGSHTVSGAGATAGGTSGAAIAPPSSGTPGAATALSSLVTKDVTGVTTIDERREDARQLIALLIVGTILVIVVCSFVTLSIGGTAGFENLKGLLEILVAPIIGIVGAVPGFYFGSSGTLGSGGR